MRPWLLFFLFLGTAYASQPKYGSINHSHSTLSRESSFFGPASVMQNSLSVSEQIANLSRAELVISGTGFFFMSILAEFSKNTCTGDMGMLAMTAIGFILLCIMIWETSFAIYIARLIYSLDFQFMDMSNSQRGIMKVCGMLATVLSAIKWLALVIPTERGSAVQDFCDEEGKWCDPRWLLGEIIPSFGIFALTFALMHQNDRIIDRNKEAKHTV